jgi:hypothetical protein
MRRGAAEHWRLVKEALTRRVVVYERPSPSETLYIKWVQIRGWKKRIGSALRPSKAVREFHLGRALLSAGYLTPTPLLFAERRQGPFLRDAFLVTRGLDAPDWVTIRVLHGDWMRMGHRREVLDLIADLGMVLRDCHDQGFVHDDCRAQHWLARPSAFADSRKNTVSWMSRWCVLDLDGSRLGRPPGWRRRRKLLAQMAASFTRPAWTSEDTFRLVQSYYADRGNLDRLAEIIQKRADHFYEKGRDRPPSRRTMH